MTIRFFSQCWICPPLKWTPASIPPRPSVSALQPTLKRQRPRRFCLFVDVGNRGQWDAMCPSIRILKVIDPLTFIYHLQLKATWPTAPRDSLALVAFRKLADGRFVSVAWSIHDDSLCPPDPPASSSACTPEYPLIFSLHLRDSDWISWLTAILKAIFLLHY